jgi:hypothetical protein
VPRPRSWIEQVNQPQTEAELEAIRTSIQRGRLFGDARWQKQAAKRLGLESTFRPRSRPPKTKTWFIGLIPVFRLSPFSVLFRSPFSVPICQTSRKPGGKSGEKPQNGGKRIAAGNAPFACP